MTRPEGEAIEAGVAHPRGWSTFTTGALLLAVAVAVSACGRLGYDPVFSPPDGGTGGHGATDGGAGGVSSNDGGADVDSASGNDAPRGGAGGTTAQGGRGGATAAGTGGGAGAKGTGGVAGAKGTGGVGGSGATGGAGAGGAAGKAGSTGGAAAGGSLGAAGRGGAGGRGAAGGARAGSGGTAFPKGALLHYAFDEASGTVANDDAGMGLDGRMAGASFTPGLYGNCASFHGFGDYIVVPDGVASNAVAMTVALWVNISFSNTWQRLVDFGNGSDAGYWYLAANTPLSSGGGLRFGITKNGRSGEQVLDGPTLSLNQWRHVAVVLTATTATLYLDGAVVSTLNSLTLHPADIGSTTNNWLGKSQYSDVTIIDPYFNGHIDDFYIFTRALSTSEIAVLMDGAQ